MKFRNRNAVEHLHETVAKKGGGDLSKMVATRDSFLRTAPSYQFEVSTYGTWIESDGKTQAMAEEGSAIPNASSDSCDNPHGLMIQASFVAPKKRAKLFRTKYQRNNKRGGQKNLRCFPGCRNGTHVASGFCGDTINVHVVMSRITTTGGVKICPFQATNPGICTFCRFVPLDSSYSVDVSGPQVEPGQALPLEDVKQHVRNRENPIRPLMAGTFKGCASEGTMQSAVFEFNADSKAWHYGWSAPRGQGQLGGDMQHVLEVLFFKPMGTVLYCLEILRSDAFTVFSSRRGHSQIKHEDR